MIVLSIGLQLKPDGRDAFIEAAKVIVTESNKEEGCILYQFATNISDANTIHISEIWQSKEILDAHGNSEHMAVFQKAIAGLVEKRHYLHHFEVTPGQQA